MIGIFDSGIGGLTVAREIIRALPGEGIVYLGDSRRAPYGDKPADVLEKYAYDIISFLMGHNIRILVIACGTISATCIDAVRKMVDLPVFDMISAVCDEVDCENIGIIATDGTIRSAAHKLALESKNPAIRVVARACPLFVPLIEEGWIDGEIPDLVAARYLGDLAAEGLDGLILGCTHYPLLAQSISRALPGVPLINPAENLAAALAGYIGNHDMQNPRPIREFYTTGDIERFRKMGEQIIGKDFTTANHANICK
ncbi:MAG: glutamate racemase [Defluviitaleaceae bacterium]|nr:glutamate racemase [Defluviitaleaceae bacterium]